MKLLDYLAQLTPEARERLLGRIEGMTLAMRIARNRAEDCINMRGSTDRPQTHWTLRTDEAHNIAALIRLAQVEIGSARQLFGPLTEDELDEIRRIY